MFNIKNNKFNPLYNLIKANVKFNSSNNLNKVNPWFITGLTDGDGTLVVNILKSNRAIVGWLVVIGYHLVAANNFANLGMLQEINVSFNNIGSIITSPDKSTITLNIRGFKNCLIVRDHFLSFPLLTYKLVYFTVWSKI
jgi:hypothetical protein